MEQNTRRYFYIVFFVFCCILLVQLGEIGARLFIGSSWDTTSQRRSMSNLARAVESFVSIQNTTLGIGSAIAEAPDVRSALGRSIPDTLALFPAISGLAREEHVGVEVYGRTGSLLAWEGPSGPPHQREISLVLRGTSVSIVDRTSIYSQLVIIVPVRRDSSILGVVVVRRVIDVDYPVENKFVDGEDLAEDLTATLGVPVLFDFSPDAEATRDGRFVSGALYGVDSSIVGVVNVGAPLRSAYIESLTLLFDRITSVGVALLAGLLAIGAIKRFGRVRSFPVRLFLVTGTLWLCRYVFLWSGFPSNVLPAGFVDPANFASQFGGGIAKSIGELTVTSLTLGINAWLSVRYVVEDRRVGATQWVPRYGVARFALSVCAITLIWFLVRGYAAVIRSGVYDSTLKYMDPKVILPPLEMGLMVFNLFLIGVVLVVAVSAMLSFMVGMFSGHARYPWITTFVWLSLGSVVFGLFHPSPMTTFSYRLFFCICVTGFTYYAQHSARKSLPILSLRNFLLMLGLSAAFLYPLLIDHIVHKDRDRIQAFAAVVLRPSDSWLKYLVQESLLGFLDIQTEDILANGQREDINQLAFSHWARSTVNREGYSSLFAVVDADGKPLSTFQIGGGELEKVEHEYLLSSGDGGARVFETGPEENPTKAYVGSVPIPEHSEKPFAYAIVIIAAGKQELIRDENLPFLRSDQQERVQSFYRPIIVTEYQHGIISATRNNPLSMNYRLPDTLRNALRTNPAHSIWVNESISGKRYQTLYAQAAAGEDRVIALTVGDIDLSAHLYNIVRVVVYYTLIVTAILALLAIAGLFRGRVYRFTFRDKLLVAFVLTALIPLIIIAVYTRSAAQARMLQGISNRLERETSSVELELRARTNTEHPDDTTAVHEPATTLDKRLLPDYNFYSGTEIEETTRPELFEAGLLDIRLSGTAYCAIVVEGKRFYVQTESIGRFRYVVGYRPLLNAQGRALGVVSVPTLYRQDQIETDAAQRNALLFGVLAFVCLGIGIVATVVANRLAGPIHRLTDATKRVSLGDLDVNLSADEQNGEVGELIRSFDTMTKDLKKNREHVVRYERELAWKEMAKQVAHEIKNPLTPMKLSLQHLQQLYHDGIDDFGKVLDEISKTVIDQIDGLSRIASEFSHFARMPARNPEHLDINAVLMEASSLFEGEQQVEFGFTLQKGLPLVLADRDELRRAFVNIIRNGIQAMNGRGLVSIATSGGEDRVDVLIADSGAGVPEEFREKLFEPNFSTKTEGMGLGLAIVKNTIDDMRGTISIASTTGKGATVTISLPVSPAAHDGGTS